MNAVIAPSQLSGSVPAIASKSMAHRLLILTALTQTPVALRCPTTSADIEATARCLRALGLRDARDGSSVPQRPAQPALLDCGESGSTLRFLLPVVGALGISAVMRRHGRLAERPLEPLVSELEAHGMHVVAQGSDLLVSGRLRGGRFRLPGNVSSQYASGLLMAAPLLDEPVVLELETPVQSRPYLELTTHALAQFGVRTHVEAQQDEDGRLEVFSVEPQPLAAPAELEVEGDWSNAAFWLAAGALEPQGLTVSGLDLTSPQGDRMVLAALAGLGARVARRGNAARVTADTPRAASFDVAPIPDLVPPLAAVAATMPGTTTFRNAGRLRLKESDRLATVAAAVNALGGSATIDGDDLRICGVTALHGGRVDAACDHRIAMMAAVMATHATGEVSVLGADCVAKSYPDFWADYARLGGIVTMEGA